MLKIISDGVGWILFSLNGPRPISATQTPKNPGRKFDAMGGFSRDAVALNKIACIALRMKMEKDLVQL